MSNPRIAVMALALVVAACGGDRGGKSSDNGNNNQQTVDNNEYDGSADNLKTVNGPVSEDRAKSVITDRVCEAYATCRCGEIAGVDLSNCRVGLQFSYDASLERVRELGLTYDGQCVERLVNAMANRGCAPPDGSNIYCREENCQVYYGTKGVGEQCDGGLSWSDCQQGLVCVGECQEPCRTGAVNLPEGSVCYDRENDIYGQCEEGLNCDTTGDGTCKALPTVGQPCLGGGLCSEGLYCNQFEGEPYICEPQFAEGAACTYPISCETLNCTDGVCGPLPGQGEPCTQRCAGDLVCAFDGESAVVCMTLPQEGEPCLMNSATPCEDGLTCNGDTCVAKPSIGERCGDADQGVYLTCAEGSVCSTVLCRLKPETDGCSACAGQDDCTTLACQEIPPAVCADSGYLLY